MEEIFLDAIGKLGFHMIADDCSLSQFQINAHKGVCLINKDCE